MNFVKQFTEKYWERIRDYNYILFHQPDMEVFLHSNSYMQRPFSVKLLRYFVKLVLGIFRDIYCFRKIQINIKNKIVFLGHSSNSTEVLEPLAALYGHQGLYIATMEEYDRDKQMLPNSLIMLFSILMLPQFFLHFLIASPSEKKIINWFLPSLVSSYGSELFWRFIFAFFRPKGIIVANDHSFETRIPSIIAREKQVPIFYIQHAPVTRYFPPLKFNVAFLEGDNSLHCYNTEQSKNVILVGNIKFEKVRNRRNSNDTVRCIGIAGSSFLTKKEFHYRLDVIKNTFKEIKIIFRPHPDSVNKDWEIPNGVEFSDVRNEKTFEFLARIDLVIGGESGILAEAALMNVYPVMYKEENPEVILKDSYGFIRHGVCELAYSIDDLLRIIRQQIACKENAVHRAKYFYSNWSNPFALNPYEQIIDTIKQHISNPYWESQFITR